MTAPPDPPDPRAWKGAAELLPAALCAVGAALLALGGAAPALWDGGGSVPVLIGEGVDLLGTLWTYDHVDRMLRGQGGMLRQDVFAPVGLHTGVAQGMAWMDAVLAWPLVRLLGVPGFYDPWILLLLVLDLLGLYGLCRALRAPPLASMGLAAAVAWSPFVQRELFEGRPTQVVLFFHAAFLACAWRLARGEGAPLRQGLLGGLALACACLTWWFGGMAVGLLGAILVGLGLLRPAAGRRGALTGGLVLAAAALLLCLAVVHPVLPDLARQSAALPLADPTQAATLADAALRSGVPASLLSGALLLALAARGRAAGPWLLATLLLGALPLGAWVRLGGHPLPLPLLLLEQLLPPFRRLFADERLAVVPLLGLAGIAAASTGALARTPARARRLGLLALLVAAGSLAESRLRDPRWQPRTCVDPMVRADFYRELATRWPGGIVDLPLHRSNLAYAYQVVHRQPVLGGPGISGPHTQPAAHRAWVADNDFLAALEEVAAGRPAPAWSEADRRALYAAGFRTVVVHLPDGDPDLLARLVPLLGPPLLTAADRVVMPLTGPARPGPRPSRESARP